MKNIPTETLILEALEDRIAPAAIGTFTDVDGDIIIIKLSKGTDADLDPITGIVHMDAEGIALIDLADVKFSGTNITISVKKSDDGDGLVNVGHLDATEINLGKVKISGSLGDIDAGTLGDNPKTVALKNLKVVSLGSTLGDSLSQIQGKVGSLIVKAAMVNGKEIGGDITGTFSVGDGGSLKSARIDGSLDGQQGGYHGLISVNGSIGSISIKGSVIGGSAIDEILWYSGAIMCGGDLGSLKINGDLKGGDSTGTGGLQYSGCVIAEGQIKSANIQGSILGGEKNGSGAFVNNAAIRAGENLKSLLVEGDIIGHKGIEERVLITGLGQGSNNVAIGKINVNGKVENTLILAGYDTVGSGIDGSGGASSFAQIKSITIGGDLIASSIAAGMEDGGDADPYFGNDNDHALHGAFLSKIAKIVIKGKAIGTAGDGDCFGIVAMEIGSAKIGSIKLSLTKGGGNDHILVEEGGTADFYVNEILA